MNEFVEHLTKMTSEKRLYILRTLPTHLVEASYEERFRKILTTFDFLYEKLKYLNLQLLLEDFEGVNDEDLILLQRAIRLAAGIVQNDKTQLASQLLGRLSPRGSPALQNLLKQARKWHGAYWLHPLLPSLPRAGDPLLFTLSGHKALYHGINALALTPDGQRVITAGEDKLLKIWDIASGLELESLQGHLDEINDVVVTPDGRRLLSVSYDGTFIVWDLVSGKQVSPTIQYLGSLRRVIVTPQGELAILARYDGSLCLLELKTFVEVNTLTGHRDWVMALAVTRDGKLLVSASDDGTARVWDLGQGTERFVLEGHTGAVRVVALTPDDRQVVTGSSDGTLRVWDLTSGELIHILSGHGRQVEALALTPDGKLAVSGSVDDTLRVWELTTGVTIHTLRGSSYGVEAISITPNGRLAISASTYGVLEVWDLVKGVALGVLGQHDSVVMALVITFDGRQVISASNDGVLKVWDLDLALRLGMEIHTTPHRFDSYRTAATAVALTSGGIEAVIALKEGEGTLTSWRTKDGLKLGEFSNAGPIMNLKVVPDGEWVVCLRQDGYVLSWNLKSGETKSPIKLHGDQADFMTLTPNARFAAFGKGNGAFSVYDIARGVEVVGVDQHTAGVTDIAVTPDGQRVITLAEGGALYILDVLTSIRLTLPINPYHQDWLCKVAVTPDGQYAIAGSEAGDLQVYNIGYWLDLLILFGHGRYASGAGEDVRQIEQYDLTYCHELLSMIDLFAQFGLPDFMSMKSYEALKSHTKALGHEPTSLSRHHGRIWDIETTDRGQAISTSGDRTLKVWDLEGGTLVATFTADSPLLDCSVDLASMRIITSDQSGRWHVVQLESPETDSSSKNGEDKPC